MSISTLSLEEQRSILGFCMSDNGFARVPAVSRIFASLYQERFTWQDVAYFPSRCRCVHPCTRMALRCVVAMGRSPSSWQVRRRGLHALEPHHRGVRCSVPLLFPDICVWVASGTFDPVVSLRLRLPRFGVTSSLIFCLSTTQETLYMRYVSACKPNRSV